MRTAIIGCGHIAQVHMWALENMEDVEPVAFVDCNLEKAQNMAEKYTNGKAFVYKESISMLEQVKPDVVHICTPHYLHVPMAIEALKRNVSVFMEKPPAITNQEFENLAMQAKNSKAAIGFCFQNRYNLTTKELDKLVISKELGEVIGARGFVTWKREADYYADEWHGKIDKEGGGVLINQSIHTLDLILRYLGKPIRVEASMHNYHLKNIIEVEDTLEAFLEFENEKRATFYATNAYVEDAPVILEIAFEKGRAMAMNQTLMVCPNGEMTRVVDCGFEKQHAGKNYWGYGHLACIEDYYDCLRRNLTNKNDLGGVANTFYTTMKIYDAARGVERKEK